MKATETAMGAEKNSLDLLRLVAATLVLYSHQFALLGSPDPSFFGWNTFGGAGVNIFFFLSGMLVWFSWHRDPDWGRFFYRRSLRIFPALWVAVILTVLLLGPAVSTLVWQQYFGSLDTSQYFATALFINQHNLPGVFSESLYPRVVNGSLWTLPVEFLCYISVSMVGSLKLAQKGALIAANLLIVVLLASWGPRITGARFWPHFKMPVVFWWGVLYSHWTQAPWRITRDNRMVALLAMLAFLFFAFAGERSFECTALVACAACLVHLARRVWAVARLTVPVGDLSYGMYIFSFQVQQMLVYRGHEQSWGQCLHFGLSLLGASLQAYASWHLVEGRALHYKPKTVNGLKVPVV